ncbi:YbaB/EbfC family nucleoid-associated protein [Saccharomonospora piscinae]|uniref:YbaB/EbfC family nucleoid-associated protein n=1 Tax=Saccharomonospora piscinae TaxID=687388 RepID=UPI00046431F5|nr:YbaB/EbfC family nucleoid-associated protein [Saccharomonospora piscinae]
MSAHMDDLIAQFSKFRSKIREAETRFEGVGDMQQQITEIRHTVTSPDGTVTVVAGAGGAVTDLTLSPSATRLDHAQLASVILSTMREAVAGAVQQQAGIVDESFGDTFGLNTSERVREAQAEAFGTAEQDGESNTATPSPGRRSSPPDEDDYFDDQGPILRR